MENQMHRANFWLTPKDLGSSSPDNQLTSILDSISVSSSSSSCSSLEDEYNPVTNGDGTNQLAPDPLRCKPPPCPRSKPPSSAPRVFPAVGAFTVQCDSCSKWRLIPTKKKYEEIREHIIQHPFVCEKAREWRRSISCDVPEDISQDDNLIWAMDKAEIPQTPDGWQRHLRIRVKEAANLQICIYYIAPSGKRFRSLTEVKKFLAYHRDYMKDGVTPERFSFQLPTPLQENYVKKKRSRAKSVEPKQVSPLAWADPEDGTNSNDPVIRPAKNPTTRSSLHS